jgi:hypothetical protein
MCQSPRKTYNFLGKTKKKEQYLFKNLYVPFHIHATVEALQFHSYTQFHWSRGSTICFPIYGVSGLRPGDAQTHKGTRFLLLALSHYIGDPNVIRSLASLPSSGSFTRLCADNVKSRLDRTSHAFPGSIPRLAGPPPPHNTVTG